MIGKVPFQGDAYAQVLIQHMTRIPARPSSLRDGIPPHVEAVVMKALAKSPDARYPSMEELMKALDDPAGYVDAHGGLDGFVAGTIEPGADALAASGATTGTTRRLGPAPIAEASTTVPEYRRPAPADQSRPLTTLSSSARLMKSISGPNCPRTPSQLTPRESGTSKSTPYWSADAGIALISAEL